MTRESRPDFFIIGAMKCATSTLHVQLSLQPGFYMSEPKEPNFFSDDDVFKLGLGWYRGLFEGAAHTDLRGESSTHYTKLPRYPHTIERLLQSIGDGPSPKLVYVMRHPIDRLISHYIHEWTEGKLTERIDSAVQQLPDLVDFGCYAKQLEPWIDAFGKESILPLFTDSLHSRPQEALQRVCKFLGYAETPVWCAEQARNNVGRLRVRKSTARTYLSAFPPFRWAFRNLLPKPMVKRIKGQWMMTEKPVLSTEVQAQLAVEFDRDLANFQDWFGLELNCRNWKAVAAEANPEWL